MADHSKPTLTSSYSNFVIELDGRFDDLAAGLDPAVTTATNLPTNSIRWSSSVNKWQKYNGTSWIDLTSLYAISISGNAATVTNGVYTTGSYVNPSWISSIAGSKITGDITGNAGSATKLATARNINGVAFDGTTAISINTNNNITFNNSGSGISSGGTFNGSNAVTVSYNSVGAPSTTGTNASGTWAINISGNAATASVVADSSVTTSKIANSAVTTLKLADGAATGSKLGSDVVVVSGDQSISGQKTFTSTVYVNATTNGGFAQGFVADNDGGGFGTGVFFNGHLRGVASGGMEVYDTGDYGAAVKLVANRTGVSDGDRRFVGYEMLPSGIAKIAYALNPTSLGEAQFSRAWVKFRMSDGFRFGYGNVSSVTRIGTGHHRVNFNTALINAAYCVLATVEQGGDPAVISANSLAHNTGYVEIQTKYSAGNFGYADYVSLSVAVIL